MAKQTFHGVGAIPTGKKKTKKKVAARAWKPVKSARLTSEQKAARERTLKAKAALRKAEREERRLARAEAKKEVEKEQYRKKKAERAEKLRKEAAARKAEKPKAKSKAKPKAKGKGKVRGVVKGKKVKKGHTTGKEELKKLKIKKPPVIEGMRTKYWHRDDVKYQLTMEADYINNETGEIRTVDSYSKLSRGYGNLYLKAAEAKCIEAGLARCAPNGASRYHWGLYEILDEQWIERRPYP